MNAGKESEPNKVKWSSSIAGNTMEDRDEGSNISRRTWYQNQRGGHLTAYDRNWGKPILWHIMKYYSDSVP